MHPVTLPAFERKLTGILEAALTFGLFALLSLILVLVAMRYVFQTGLVGANETATIIFVYLSAIGAAVALGRQEHIRVDLVPRRLGPRWRRRVDLATLALVGLFNAVLVERGVAWIATTGHTPMPATQLPRYIAQISVPLGCGLAALYCGTRIVALARRGTDA